MEMPTGKSKAYVAVWLDYPRVPAIVPKIKKQLRENITLVAYDSVLGQEFDLFVVVEAETQKEIGEYVIYGLQKILGVYRT